MTTEEKTVISRVRALIQKHGKHDTSDEGSILVIKTLVLADLERIYDANYYPAEYKNKPNIDTITT